MPPVLRALASDSSDSRVVGKALRAASRPSDCRAAGNRAALVVPVLARAPGVLRQNSDACGETGTAATIPTVPWLDTDEIATVLRSPVPQRVAMRRAQN